MYYRIRKQRFYVRAWRSYRRWYSSLTRRGRVFVRFAAVLGFAALLYAFILASPVPFPEGVIVSVPAGQSVRATAHALKEKGVIRSTLAYEALIRLTSSTGIAGEYSFQSAQNVFTVSKRISHGDFRITPIRVKVVEGATVMQIAELLGERLPHFDTAEFLRLAEGKEGYLFPDTYFILPDATPETVLGMFTEEFDEQIRRPGVQAALSSSGKSLSEVVIMASLLEREAPDTADRRVIAGILWKRIDKGMNLQVDAVFPYILGKNSFELTRADLAVDSPYNTYVYKGLPAGPIANPSMDAILAALDPVSTQYWYYLSDMHGVMHYSATYEQHLAAKRTYIGS